MPGLTEAEALAALPDGVAFAHVGTLGLVLEPMAAALEAIAGILAGRALVMVDPNCRPAIISRPRRVPRAPRARVRNADVVKVSEEDLEWLAPGVPPAQAARALLGQGPSVVLFTRGGDGALVLTAEGEQAVAAPPRRGRRHDRRGRRILGWLAGVVVRARPGASRAGRRRCRRGRDSVRLPRRRAHVCARGRLTTDPRRAFLTGLTR